MSLSLLKTLFLSLKPNVRVGNSFNRSFKAIFFYTDKQHLGYQYILGTTGREFSVFPLGFAPGPDQVYLYYFSIGRPAVCIISAYISHFFLRLGKIKSVFMKKERQLSTFFSPDEVIPISEVTEKSGDF